MFARVLFAVLFAMQVAACGLYSGPGVPDINETSAGSDATGDISGDGVVQLEN